MDTDAKGLHEDITQDVSGAAFDIHNALGCGLLWIACSAELPLCRKSGSYAPALQSATRNKEARVTKTVESDLLRTAQVREASRLILRARSICVHPCPSVVD